MRIWTALTVGVAMIVGVGICTLPTRSAKPRDGIVVASAGSSGFVPVLRSTPTPAASPTGAAAPVGAAAAATEPEGVPKNYPYWENDEAGEWATPAEFSTPE